MNDVTFLFRVILLVWRSLTHTNSLVTTTLLVLMLIRVLSIVLLIENNTTSHQILSWIDSRNIVLQFRLRLNDYPLLLWEGRHLLIMDLIPVLDTFPIDTAWELSMHHGCWGVQIIANVIIIQLQWVQIRSVLWLHKLVRLVGAMMLVLMRVFRTWRTW